MGFGQAHVARTAQAKTSDPLRKRAFNPHSLIVQKGPIRLTVSRPGCLQGLILGARPELNARAFRPRTLRANRVGPAVLAWVKSLVQKLHGGANERPFVSKSHSIKWRQRFET